MPKYFKVIDPKDEFFGQVGICDFVKHDQERTTLKFTLPNGLHWGHYLDNNIEEIPEPTAPPEENPDLNQEIKSTKVLFEVRGTMPLDKLIEKIEQAAIPGLEIVKSDAISDCESSFVVELKDWPTDQTADDFLYARLSGKGLYITKIAIY